MNTQLKELEDKALAVFIKKDEWKNRFNNAPEGAKEYYRLMFALSTLALVSKDGQVDMGSLGADEERDRIYHSMDDESWKYILDNAGHSEALGLAIARKHMQGKPDVKFGDWLKKSVTQP